jgi:hypothetical protein
MAWLPIALRYLDLLFRYGPTIYRICVEIYELIERIRKDGDDVSAFVLKSDADVEVALLKASPKPDRKPERLARLRDRARMHVKVS